MKRVIAVAGDTVAFGDEILILAGVPVVDVPVGGPCSYHGLDDNDGPSQT